MKVAIVSDHLPGFHKIWSGAELIAVTLHDMLKKTGAEAFFLTSTFDANENRRYSNVFEIKTPLKKYEVVLGNFPVDLKAIGSLHKILREQKPDIVHINGKYLYLPSIIVCSRLRIPFVYTVADYWLFCPRTFIRKPDGSRCEHYHGAECLECLGEMKEGSVKKIVSRIPAPLLKIFFLARKVVFNHYNRKVKTYVALSETSKNRLVDYGIPSDNVRVIYHYFLKELQETNERIDPTSAIFIGWLSVENGIHVLVDAFIKVLEDIPEAKLYLIGTGKDRFVADLKKKINSNNAQNNILFLGKKENAEALSIMTKCDVVVVPHQWPKEFGPIVLIEAAALEKPVVTSKTGATHEFVSDTVNGFLVEDFRNPSTFAEKIKYLLSNPETAKEMGEKGRENVRFVFDNSYADELIQLYNSLIK